MQGGGDPERLRRAKARAALAMYHLSMKKRHFKGLRPSQDVLVPPGWAPADPGPVDLDPTDPAALHPPPSDGGGGGVYAGGPTHGGGGMSGRRGDAPPLLGAASSLDEASQPFHGRNSGGLLDDDSGTAF